MFFKQVKGSLNLLNFKQKQEKDLKHGITHIFLLTSYGYNLTGKTMRKKQRLFKKLHCLIDCSRELVLLKILLSLGGLALPVPYFSKIFCL